MTLFDTHALLWWREEPHRLGREATRVIGEAELRGELAVSAITFQELGRLLRRGTVTISADLRTWRRDLLADGVVELPVDGEVALKTHELLDRPADPVDQVLMATAANRHTLITADEEILAWRGPLERVRAND